jgi:FixJ family two-component response regulator
MATPAPLIVVVEDDLPTLKALGRVLRAAGFETATYSSAEDYLASPPQQIAHCLLLDIHLGGMSGLDLQRHLRAHGSHLPVIVMTAFDDAHVRDEATRIGCAGYLDKATDIDVLLSLIRSFPPSRPPDSAKAL